MSERFPQDAPLGRMLKALVALGFAVIRKGNHLALARTNGDGSVTPLTLPNHRTLKGATLRALLRQSGIGREECLAAYAAT